MLQSDEVFVSGAFVERMKTSDLMIQLLCRNFEVLLPSVATNPFSDPKARDQNEENIMSKALHDQSLEEVKSLMIHWWEKFNANINATLL